MSSLLSRSLGDVKNQSAPSTGPSRSGSSRSSRDSPYSRPSEDKWKHDLYNKAPPPVDAQGNLKKSNKLFISNLHYEGLGQLTILRCPGHVGNSRVTVSETELEKLFAQIGPLSTLPKINYDRSGRSQGTARLAYGSEGLAQRAKEAFDGASAKGQPITVQYDFRVDRVVPEPGTLLARLESDIPNKKNRPYEPPTSGPRPGGPSGAPRVTRKPATATDLDAELDAFMGADKKGVDSVNAGKSTDASADVEMS
ncbi:hypothetical protein MNV49_007377 [Pseudohyphozyma bogoriensis]|nr:hypothetical protein MNV49_007377 [Pseudohyphozyma bogoriensis]